MFDLSKIKLKPCPFCGGEAYISMQLRPHIECFHKRSCRMQPNTWLISLEPLKKQIKAWNMRTSNDDNLIRPTDEIHVNEVVYTKSSVCVLDVGLVESITPLSIYARCSKLDGDSKSYYGNPSGSNWYGTGIYKTYNQWKDLTIDWIVEWKDSKDTEEICNILGIPYWMKGVMRNDTRRSD